MKFSNHLKALLRKNYILWKRNYVCSIIEIIFPAALACFFYIIRQNIQINYVDSTSFMDPKYNELTKEVPVFTILASDYQQIGINPKTQEPIFPFMKDCLTGHNNEFPNFRNGHVALIDESSFLSDLTNIFVNDYKYQVKKYKNVQELEDWATSNDYKEDICFGIAVDSYQNNQFKFRFFFNSSDSDDFHLEIPNSLNKPVLTYVFQKIIGYFLPWREGGFLTIQNWIDNIILRKVTGDNKLKITPSVTSMIVPKHGDDILDKALRGNFASYIILPMILAYLRMTYGLLTEKEKKIREGMKVMGMNDASFYVSWILHYLLIYIIISILVTSVLKTAIFQSSDWSVIFVWHLLFGVSLIFQSIFITTFFTKAKIGNIVAMVFFLFQYMIVFIVQNNKKTTRQTKLNVSILPQTGTTFACDVFLFIEGQQKGISWNNLNYDIDNYSIETNMYMNVLNIVIFIILSIYFDQVFPNDFGKKRHPLFFIRWIWKKSLTPEQRRQQLLKKAIDEESAINFDENIEDVAKNLKDQEIQSQVVTLQNVRKVYPSGKSAVNGLNFTMYNGQIFALLGHNGAGKTSTISMLTGMYEMTDGQAVALGKDVQSEMGDIRQFMGVCPQYDILFDHLSVKEHLELFAVFKGMTDKKMIEEEVKKHIADVDLAEKTNELAKNLSGGQRRRLSVAIAFIGGSKLIYLDEPTSGMDTSARRHIWDMLKRYKNDKVICLTTHFMDEADYLGDRIGIMADGQIVCLGRPLFLKNKFGTGYNLTIVKKNPTDSSEPIIKFIQVFIPEAKILSDVSAEISFLLKNEKVSQFSFLFNSLDQNLQQLSIQTYGISITTLEDVFLRVANLKKEKKQQKKQQLFKENIQQEKDKICITTQGVKCGSDEQLETEKEFCEVDNIDFSKIRITNPTKIFWIHLRALVTKRAIYFKRDIRSLLCEIILPCLVIVFGLSLTKITFLLEQPSVEFLPKNFPTPLKTVVSKQSFIPDSTANDILDSFRFYSDYEFIHEYSSETPNSWDEKVFSYKTTDSVCAFFLNEIISDDLKYTTQINTIYRDATPFAVNQMNEALINYKLRQMNKPTISIEIISSPLPLTQKIKSLENTASGLLTSLIYSIGLSFVPASIITFTVKERTDKIKHQQIVSGVSLFSYWFSNFLIDLVKFIFPAVFSFAMIYAYNIKPFKEDNCMGAVVLLHFLYGWSVITFTYFLGFFFTDYGNAQVAAFFINFVQGGLFPIFIYILRVIKGTRSGGIILGQILRIFPAFCFGYGIINIGNRNLYAHWENKSTADSPYDKNISGGDLIFALIEGFFFFGLVFCIEFSSRFGRISHFISKETSVPYVQKQYDQDVQNEIDNVEKSQPSNFSVCVNKLRKVFKPSSSNFVVAIDQVSFGIRYGECFTLLGVNGAGKTTTFKILSGEINQTSGQCHINGFDATREYDKARANIGYCPQFDALIENLTAREHLEFYSDIKGIPNFLRERLVKQKLIEMDLVEFEHKLAGTYSGGNKRKLSVAIAMIGNPTTVFLDEPSTGMDPATRRFMWSVISRISTKRKSSSVILTTHSMEEAEALSTRIAIQVEGILKCIGTVQQIKDKFGEGYEVEVKLNVPSDDEIIKYVAQFGINQQEAQKHIHYNELQDYLQKLNGQLYYQQISPDKESSQLYSRLNSSYGVSIISLAQYIILEIQGEMVKKFIKESLGEFAIIEHFDDFYRFRILSDISIGKIFESFEQNKEKLFIDNYSVKQATIEQIFNLFATNQIPLNFTKKQNQNKLPVNQHHSQYDISNIVENYRKVSDNQLQSVLSIPNSESNFLRAFDFLKNSPCKVQSEM